MVLGGAGVGGYFARGPAGQASRTDRLEAADRVRVGGGLWAHLWVGIFWRVRVGEVFGDLPCADRVGPGVVGSVCMHECRPVSSVRCACFEER